MANVSLILLDDVEKLGLAGEEVHHVFEAVFKGFAKALDQAVGIDPRIAGVLSTKGSL